MDLALFNSTFKEIEGLKKACNDEAVLMSLENFYAISKSLIENIKEREKAFSTYLEIQKELNFADERARLNHPVKSFSGITSGLAASDFNKITELSEKLKAAAFEFDRFKGLVESELTGVANAFSVTSTQLKDYINKQDEIYDRETRLLSDMKPLYGTLSAEDLIRKGVH